MTDECKREIETFKQDYQKLYAKGQWKPEEISMMKDLKKLIYYSLAIEAMESGEGHPGEGHLPEMSYARGRNRMGQYTSGNGMYYDDMGHSGRMYYDSEKERAIHQLQRMHDNTDDPERRNALRTAIEELKMR